MKRWQHIALGSTASILMALLMTTSAAAQYASPQYQVNEVFFGSGGELNQTSASYSAQSAVGELGVGTSTSTNFLTHAGFNTTEQPYLEFVVTSSNIDLGSLSTLSTSTATGTFSVRAWLASGYSVETLSSPPTSNTPFAHVLTPLASPTASSAGTEQFGINLVKNTNFCGVGCHLGADPVQSPDATFSFGQAAAGYNTANQFKYTNGDIIAQSTQSTSITTYTISYIFNISSATQSGQYNFSHVLVATGTY